MSSRPATDEAGRAQDDDASPRTSASISVILSIVGAVVLVVVGVEQLREENLVAVAILGVILLAVIANGWLAVVQARRAIRWDRRHDVPPGPGSRR